MIERIEKVMRRESSKALRSEMRKFIRRHD